MPDSIEKTRLLMSQFDSKQSRSTTLDLALMYHHVATFAKLKFRSRKILAILYEVGDYCETDPLFIFHLFFK